MGFSVTAASAILFAAAFISLAALLSGYSDMRSDQNDAERFTYQHLIDASQQGVSILQINATQGTISVENIGNSELATGDIDVVINGTIRTADISDIVIIDTGHSAVWFPGEILQITMDCSLVEAKVMVYAGISARAYAG